LHQNGANFWIFLQNGPFREHLLREKAKIVDFEGKMAKMAIFRAF
jgi:hypothetical protein